MFADSGSSPLGTSPFGTRRRSAAAAAAAAAAAVDRATLVTFSIAGVIFAAPVESVERVVRFAPLSPATEMSGRSEGVIEYRGAMVPVVDLRRTFGQNPATGASTRTLVFNTQPEWTAAIVDDVREVITVDAASIAPPSTIELGVPALYLLGTITHRGRTALVLDVGKALAARETLSLETPNGTGTTVQNDEDN